MNPNLLKFLTRLEIVIHKTRYGTITGNVIIQNGLPNLKTFSLVTSKRIRFPIGKKLDENSLE